MPQPSLIDMRNVTKIYRVGTVDVHALRGVDLSIPSGELCCIVGRSGSGKSTMLHVLAGLEKVTSGEIVMAGKRLDRMTQSELIVFRQAHVGFIFQSFNLLPYYTAIENVALPLSFRGVSKYERLRRAKRMLTSVGLATHLWHKPDEMSGGQQQRVGIARALITNPDIVFADELTGNLDSSTSDEVMRAVSDIIKEQGKTLIMVSHDPNMAKFCDRVVNLLDGKIISITECGAQHAELAPEAEELKHEA